VEEMEKFDKLDAEKQQKIRDAALKEFAEKGYEKASTNQIVKEAGIGKGMLFYYFKSKKELYEYLVESGLTTLVEEYFKLADTREPDFFERLKKIAQIKLQAQTENVHLFNFIGTVMLTTEVELPAHLQKKYEEMQEMGYTMLYAGIDKSKFRDDVDVEKAFQLIQWAIDGYQSDLTHRLRNKKLATIDFGPYWAEYYEYLDILKKSFYKEGKREQ
jgi:AcrR family transcriptional regulator